MQVGTPVSLEEAILFLYGKKPKITPTNVAYLLGIAEYLLIPGLKAHCVWWLNQAEITDTSFISMLKLASIYDLSSYDEYLNGHLHDLITTEGFVDLTPASVEYIISDSVFSYVKTSEKFSFLVRWTNGRPNRRTEFGKLVKHINFEDLEKDFITENVIREPLIVNFDDAKDILDTIKSMTSITECDVLLCPENFANNKVLGLDLTRGRWCSINIEAETEVSRPEGFHNYKIRNTELVRGIDHSEVYMFGERCIFTMNLESNTVKKSTVSESHECQFGNDGIDFLRTKKCILEGRIFLISNELVERVEKQKDENQASIPPELLRLAMLTRNPYDALLINSAINSHFRKERLPISVLYTGKIENENVTIDPILSLRVEISHVCANKTAIAMLSTETEILYIFDRENDTIEDVNLNDNLVPRRNGKLAATENGFVLYNDEGFINIARQIGPNLHNNHLVSQYRFHVNTTEGYYTNKYYFCENRWYHYTGKNKDNPPELCHTSHKEIISFLQEQTATGTGRSEKDIWRPLPVYEERYGYGGCPLGSKIFQVKLTKDKLSCPLNCPHCKQLRESKSETLRRPAFHDYEDDTLYDDDDDDDDEFMPYFYYDDYDSDDDYYDIF